MKLPLEVHGICYCSRAPGDTGRALQEFLALGIARLKDHLRSFILARGSSIPGSPLASYSLTVLGRHLFHLLIGQIRYIPRRNHIQVPLQ